jgi:hypothetical protein
LRHSTCVKSPQLPRLSVPPGPGISQPRPRHERRSQTQTQLHDLFPVSVEQEHLPGPSVALPNDSTDRILLLPSNATTKYASRNLVPLARLERRRAQNRLSQQAYRHWQSGKDKSQDHFDHSIHSSYTNDTSESHQVSGLNLDPSHNPSVTQTQDHDFNSDDRVVEEKQTEKSADKVVSKIDLMYFLAESV